MFNRHARIGARLDSHRNFKRSPGAARLAWAGAVHVCTPRPKYRRAPRSGRSVLLGLLLGIILGSAWTASAWGEETASAWGEETASAWGEETASAWGEEVQLSCLGCGGAGKELTDLWTNPLLERVKALSCVRLAKRSGREIVVKHMRRMPRGQGFAKAPGIQSRSSRSYTLARSSSMPLPFRGPGRTRLLGHSPCRGKEAPVAEVSDRRCVVCARMERERPCWSTAAKCAAR